MCFLIISYTAIVLKFTVILVAGVRQGYIQSKMALVKILPKYELLLDERTLVPMRIKTSSLVPQAEGDVWIKLRKLPQKT